MTGIRKRSNSPRVDQAKISSRNDYPHPASNYQPATIVHGDMEMMTDGPAWVTKSHVDRDYDQPRRQKNYRGHQNATAKARANINSRRKKK